MGALIGKLFASGLMGSIGAIIGPLFKFLNNYVDKQAQMHVVDQQTLGAAGGAIIGGLQNADNQNAATRRAEGKWAPWTIATILLFMLPTGFHYTQVLLDSCAFVPGLTDWYLPWLMPHRIGSWGVARLPGLFETTEHAIINSLFVGAGVLLAGQGLIKAIKR